MQQEVETAVPAGLSVRTIPDGFGAGCRRGSLFAVTKRTIGNSKTKLSTARSENKTIMSKK